MVQEYLFNFVREEKHRTAEKLKLQLTCIFDMAYEDFGLPSPMRKIVLPYRETKKGVALTKVEERELVNYCQNRKDDVAGALLILLYFGLRQSELASIRIIDDKFLQCEASKGRLGREPRCRKIPFTPVAKRVISMIDFQAAKTTNSNKLKRAFKRLFPNHHAYELRYTLSPVARNATSIPNSLCFGTDTNRTAKCVLPRSIEVIPTIPMSISYPKQKRSIILSNSPYNKKTAYGISIGRFSMREVCPIF